MNVLKLALFLLALSSCSEPKMDKYTYPGILERSSCKNDWETSINKAKQEIKKCYWRNYLFLPFNKEKKKVLCKKDQFEEIILSKEEIKECEELLGVK